MERRPGEYSTPHSLGGLTSITPSASLGCTKWKSGSEIIPVLLKYRLSLKVALLRDDSALSLFYMEESKVRLFKRDATN
jgi:hypothetical protein